MSTWRDYVTAALLGSGKSTPPTIGEQFASLIAEAGALENEALFLTEAGALALWRRAGWQPSRVEVSLSPCEAETSSPIGCESVGHLRAMLGGRCGGVLPEWLAEVSQRGRHVPPEYLPALLDRARQDRSLRAQVMGAGGCRAEWLAAQNPAWVFGAAESGDVWETGSRDQRVAYFRSLRAGAPAEALARLEAVWQSEPADVRADLIAQLVYGLSAEDEAFLDRALDDRSKEVRKAAVDLLARLPSSAFVARMIARAVPLIQFKRGGLLSRASLEVALPGAPDAADIRDGLDPKAFGPQKQLGEKAVLLVQIISAVPLGYWSEKFQQSPAAILKAAGNDEFARALATGWAWAALRQRNAEWATALTDGPIQPHMEFLPAKSLFSLLPEAVRAERLGNIIRGGALLKPGSPEWHACLQELAALGGRAPASLIRMALNVMRDTAATGFPPYVRSTIESWILRMPRALLPEAATNWPADQESVTPLIDLITFRHDALTALS